MVKLLTVVKQLMGFGACFPLGLRCQYVNSSVKCSCLMELLIFFFHSFQLTKEMVMEKPSPLLVGREFVRQYYTLLNQAPDYLHR